ncbi:precorrin-6y C5,15-methyltransferase (decarboxylating) subunit CbiE [bacterium]|nr:precorrin-6y C5,15-methyltransferase (decarboxylating) subunit CbiE [bacterium]
MSRLRIVGIGDDGIVGLTDQARRILGEADLVIGTTGALSLLDEVQKPKITLEADMNSALEQLRAAIADQKSPVLVSEGDPLFFGVTRFFCDRLGKDLFEVHPHVSSMQLAFARVKESWDDAYLTSLGGRALEPTLDRIRTADKVGLFPSEDIPPKRLAREMLSRGIDNFRAYVCENLGSPDERVTQAKLEELARMDFHPLNVMILIRSPDKPSRMKGSGRRRLFGNANEAFAQSQPKAELTTIPEVRAIALSYMDLRPDSIVWDVGAGSGAVAIEAAQLAFRGTVYAVEPEAADVSLILANSETFAVSNVRTIVGRAPEVLKDLPDPDAVFVGGTGRRVDPVLTSVYDRLHAGGRMVVNVVTIDGLATACETLRRLAGQVQVWNISISRGIDQMERIRFDAATPSFLLAVTKPDDTD